MAEIEAFIAAFGFPGGLAAFIIWQSYKQSKSSGGGETMTQKLDRVREDLTTIRAEMIGVRVLPSEVSALRERVAAVEAILQDRGRA